MQRSSVSFRRLCHRPTTIPRQPLGSRFSSSGPGIRRPKHLLRGATLLTATGGTTFAYLATVHADEGEIPSPDATVGRPLSALVRSYIVYSICSIPSLVDHSPAILSTMLSIPVVKWVTEAFVRATFFSQFVGGDTAEDTLPLLIRLREENKGVLFAYSVEVDERAAVGSSSGTHEAPPSNHKSAVQEMHHSIDIAAEFEDRNCARGLSSTTGRRSWVAVKLTALLPDAKSLVNLSSHLLLSRPSSDVFYPGCPHLADLEILSLPTPSALKLLPHGSPLTADDIDTLRELRDDLDSILIHAQKRNIRIIIDAEYTWYQPAIDAYILTAMRKFNRLPTPAPPHSLRTSTLSLFYSYIFPSHSTELQPSRSPAEEIHPSSVQPLVYATYQAYLRRTPEFLKQSFEDAKEHNYALGVKLVRGAYHPHELAAYSDAQRRLLSGPASDPQPSSPILSLKQLPELPPVWLTKAETDNCYNSCVQVLLRAVHEDRYSSKSSGNSAIPRVGILFGTHNWSSSKKILDGLVIEGLATPQFLPVGEKAAPILHIPNDVAERVTLAQLYGMCDNLTNYLVNRTRSSAPFVIKYIPYGELTEVMPYLGRRAIENKSVLGQGAAAEERNAAAKEIRERIWAFFRG